MTVPFTRQLGPQSGVQLNPVKDNTERFVAGDANQIAAVPGRFERGRIDKAFRVNRGNLFRMLGASASISISRLNETLVQMYEAMQRGVVEYVVYRLNVTGAVLNSMYIKDGTAASPITTAGSAPAGTKITVKHLECFNDGITLAINAIDNSTPAVTATANVPLTGTAPLTIGDTTVTNGMVVKLPAQTSAAENGVYTVTITGGNYTTAAVTTKDVKLRLSDVTTGDILYEFEGSLDPAAVNEFGASTYLPNVVASQTDNVEVTVAASASIPSTSSFYGLNTDGTDKWVSADLSYFTESSTTYDSEDYDRACTALKYGDHTFGYIHAGGTQSVPLLSKLIALGKDINKQVVWDVPGNLSVAAAIAFYNSLSIDSHYSQAYWAPLKADDPLNGGKEYIGTSGINLGYRCARNALTDANGVAPKHFPVAGKAYPIDRTGIIQTLTPTESDMKDLAKARINPVIFTRYASGGRYVFFDSLTGAKTESVRKLIAVADMSSEVDDNVSAFAQEALQLPLSEAIKRLTDFLRTYFEALETAGWLKPSAELGNRSFVAEVKPNANRPDDRVDVGYFMHYEGTARAIYIQQTFSK